MKTTMKKEHTGRHQEKGIDNTELRVIRHASEEFFRHGVKSVKMDDVASTLGISKRTIYEMFTDKEHLLLECMKKKTEQMAAEMEQIVRTAKTPVEVYVRAADLVIQHSRGVCAQFLEEVGRYPIVVEYFERGKAERQQRNQLFIQQCIEKGYFRANVNYELLRELNELTYDTLSKNGLFQRYSLFEIMKTVTDTNFRGLCTTKGAKEMDRCLKLLYASSQRDDVHLGPCPEAERE